VTQIYGQAVSPDITAVEGRLKEVMEASRLIRASLNRGQSPAKADLDKMRIHPDDPIAKRLVDLERHKVAIQESLQRLNSQRVFQTVLDRRANESKNLFGIPSK
jgi:hypothetical protein